MSKAKPKPKRKPQDYFDEKTARALWDKGDTDGCIVYSMACIPPTMAQAHLKYPYQIQWDDLEAEYMLYLVQAIQRYDPAKSRLFTWITNYLRYAELNFVRKEVKYCEAMVQFGEDYNTSEDDELDEWGRDNGLV
jgi:hypothetical protein